MNQELVKILRNQKGWSQSELAALSGLSVKTIQRVEHGQGAPSLDTAKALASIFDRPFSDFLPAAPPTEKSVCGIAIVLNPMRLLHLKKAPMCMRICYTKLNIFGGSL